MYKVCDLIEKQFLEYVEQGYGHADEQLYSPVYFKHSELFEHYYGDYQTMITNYRLVKENALTTIYHFLRNSFMAKDYKKCYEACCKVFESWCNGDCTLSEEERGLLYTYTMDCKKELQIYT
jgi:hypothetical protein